MTLESLVLFLPACLALALAFGPNNLMAVTNGAHHGVAFATLAGLGRIAAFVPMIALSAAGLGLLLATSATLFSVLKVAGAAYLVWIGARLLLFARPPETAAAETADLSSAMRREGLVALGNPKAILIFTAFFPQFVTPEHYWRDFATVGGLFLVLEVIGIALYAGVGRLVARAAARRLVWLTKASGLGMIAFGVLILFTRQET